MWTDPCCDGMTTAVAARVLPTWWSRALWRRIGLLQNLLRAVLPFSAADSILQRVVYELSILLSTRSALATVCCPSTIADEHQQSHLTGDSRCSKAKLAMLFSIVSLRAVLCPVPTLCAVSTWSCWSSKMWCGPRVKSFAYREAL